MAERSALSSSAGRAATLARHVDGGREHVNFLVRIDVRLPAMLGEAERGELLRAELVRGRELKEAGHIVSIWRLPGGLRNVGVWEARDATELHELLASLPLYPYLESEVTALAVHPLDAG